MPYKDALEEKLKELQEEYARTKYNKVTDKHLGILRAKMAKIRREIEARSKKRHGVGFGVKKAGDATVVLVGFPKAGKSSLLNALTGTSSKVADYAFTTLEAIPGMLNYAGANIQLIDLPGIIEGAHTGKGGGTKIASVMRASDLMLIVIDATAPDQLYTILDELDKLNIRINKETPAMVVEKTSSGGISVEGAIDQKDKKVVAEALIAMGTYNAEVAVLKKMPVEDLIDYIVENIAYVKGIVVINKSDLIGEREMKQLALSIRERTGLDAVAVSASKGSNLDALKEAIFKNTGLIRIYLKPKGAENADEKPMIIKAGATVEDIARKLNTKTARYLKYAYVTGPSAKFKEQKVGTEHTLLDNDTVTLVYEKHAP
ncbi:MAG: OBG GTPase family GTP-binding protein [Candidatus Micrarchaeia archaeon]